MKNLSELDSDLSYAVLIISKTRNHVGSQKRTVYNCW